MIRFCQTKEVLPLTVDALARLNFKFSDDRSFLGDALSIVKIERVHRWRNSLENEQYENIKDTLLVKTETTPPEDVYNND